MTRRRQRWPGRAETRLDTLFSSNRGDLEGMNADEHNFQGDVANGITPYFIYSERPTITAELAGDKAQVAPILQELGDDNARDTTEQLCDAVMEVARVLAWRGRAVFEIARDDQGAVRLATIPGEGLWIFPWFCLQIIPKRDRERLKKRYNIVRTNRLWVVKVPLALGGHWGYAAMKRHLAAIDHLGPNFFRRDFPVSLNPDGYNFQTYGWALDVFQEIETRKWHWDRRDTSFDHTTEMYYVYKKFGFRAAQVILRDHVVSEINRLFSILGIQASMKLTKTPTAAELLEAREKFLKGQIPIKKALAMCRLGS